MQLLGPKVNIAGEDVVHDDVLDEGAPVMLFLIEGLGLAEGDVGKVAVGLGLLVLAGAEHGVLKGVVAVDQGPEVPLPVEQAPVGAVGDAAYGIGPALTLQRQVGAGHHEALGIDDAEFPVRHIFELDHYTLKHTVGHHSILPNLYTVSWMISQISIYIIYKDSAICKWFLGFSCGLCRKIRRVD